MRPASIVQFERLYLVALAVALCDQLLGWNTVMAAMRANPAVAQLGAAFVVVGLVIVYGVLLALWYFAARRRSVIAKWAIAAWFVYTMVTTALAVFRAGLHFNLGVAIGVVSFLLLGWAVSYLFKPDADQWFASRQ